MAWRGGAVNRAESMHREIELKFRVSDFETIRKGLAALGGCRAATVLELNQIFDTPKRELFACDCGLRLRQWRSLDFQDQCGATLAFKGPRTGEGAKSRDEIETAVGDSNAVAEILRRLGFVEVVRYEKRRESWALAACEISLDELPRLGKFLEIEGPDEQQVRHLAKALGLSPLAVEAQTYVHLASVHGDQDESGCRCLEFDPRRAFPGNDRSDCGSR
jgi:adenylate cyclase class 2